MSELKTLKDIGDKTYLSCECDGEYEEGCLNCLRRDLKAEAIKWYHRSDGNKHKFIMEFFNLTEEDLKCSKE